MFKTIVVATDGSMDGDHAVEMASSLAREGHSRLVVIHVIELVGSKAGVYPLVVDEPDVQARLAADVDALKADGITAELVVQAIRLGGPAHVIADVAATADADVIIVGSKGRSELSDLILGSVPTRLLHVAHRPVLVVPRQPA